VRKLISLLFAGAAGLAVPVALGAAPASAQTPPSLVCQVIPGSAGVHSGICGTRRATTNYVVDMGLANGPTTGLSWSTPSGYPVVAGCISSTPFCDLAARGSVDQDIVTSVTFTQDGVTQTLSVDAFIPAVCGTSFC